MTAITFRIRPGYPAMDKTEAGTAEVLDRGFQMQLGGDGYKLRVIESAHYAPGTIIYAYRWSVG